MNQFRFLLPVLSLGMFATVATAFVLRHGGWQGDASSPPIGTDAISEPEDKGAVLFNRWVFVPRREPFHVRGLMYVNLPAFAGSKAVLSILGAVTDEFGTNYPFGLSYATYSLMLALILSFLQWFVIGALIDRFGRSRGQQLFRKKTV